MINIVLPMAGAGSRFVKAGYEKPKPFIDVAGKPMIVRVLENLYCGNARFILIAKREHLERERDITEKIKDAFNVVFVTVEKLTEGAACTVLHAGEFIDNDDVLMIANSDQIVDISISEYIQDCADRDLDGSILTFIDEHKDPKWSFAKIGGNGLVEEVKEKEVISEYATVGIYLFSKGRDFFENAGDMIARNDRVNNEFYVCPVYNYAVAKKKRIGIFNIDCGKMHGLGTPEDLELYLERMT